MVGGWWSRNEYSASGVEVDCWSATRYMDVGILYGRLRVRMSGKRFKIREPGKDIIQEIINQSYPLPVSFRMRIY